MTETSPSPVYFLLVDDLEENLLALEGLLRREGLALLRARSGTDALELLLKYDVALALVDVQMPGMDGFELAELMRGIERTRRVPIIFLTAGSADRQRRFRGYEAGAVDFMRKPIEPDILRSKADVFFELYRQRQEVAQQRDDLRAAMEENSRLLKESRLQAHALEQADRRKDEFLAMLAHELRNPLAPIQNAVEILRLDNPRETDVALARDIISRQVTHMARLIDDLLDVARIARGRIQLRTQQCDLTAIVRQTAEDYRPTLSAAGLTLELDVPNEPLTLIGDPVRIAQVVGNLLHNAGKFTPNGGHVHVHVKADLSGKSASVSVRDTGIGLDVSDLARLFEPFNQADQPIDRSKGGLGLGLALTKGLVELHSGSVQADSDGVGQGAEFTLSFPLATPQGNDELPESDHVAANRTNGLRILVVEDNQDSARTLQLLLTHLGHDVAVALDGKAGVQLAEDFRPDVVMSDLGLPGEVDGHTVARSIRQNPALAHTYLIAISGYGHDEDRRRAAAAGFDQHLIKPVDLALLTEAVATATTREAKSQVVRK